MVCNSTVRCNYFEHNLSEHFDRNKSCLLVCLQSVNDAHTAAFERGRLGQGNLFCRKSTNDKVETIQGINVSLSSQSLIRNCILSNLKNG